MSKIAFASIAVLYTASILVTWNETQTSRATAQAMVWLRERNIPLASIDAGYVLNGWNLYAHPENLRLELCPKEMSLLSRQRRQSLT